MKKHNSIVAGGLVAVVIALIAAGAWWKVIPHAPKADTLFYSALSSTLDFKEPIIHYVYSQPGTDYYSTYNAQYTNNGQQEVNTGGGNGFDVNRPLYKGRGSVEGLCDNASFYTRFYDIHTMATSTKTVQDYYENWFKKYQNTWVSYNTGCALDEAGYKNSITYMTYGLFIGQLPADKRQQVVNYWREHGTFTTNFKSVTHQKVNDQLMYVYTVHSDKDKLLDFVTKQFPDRSQQIMKAFGAKTDNRVLAPKSPFDFTLTVNANTSEIYSVQFQKPITLSVASGANTEYLNLIKRNYGAAPLDGVTTFEANSLHFSKPTSTITSSQYTKLDDTLDSDAAGLK